jgi:Na+-transporting methylmalonyl-CoA/oxaloacetate decarboxylase gamma subunit
MKRLIKLIKALTIFPLKIAVGYVCVVIALLLMLVYIIISNIVSAFKKNKSKEESLESIATAEKMVGKLINYIETIASKVINEAKIKIENND